VGGSTQWGSGWNSLGGGYVSFVDSILGAVIPGTPITVLNTGISGNRVTDLESRWQSDVLDLEPNWLSVMIGINDVWRQFDSEPGAEQVEPEQYELVYRSVLAKTRPQLGRARFDDALFLGKKSRGSDAGEDGWLWCNYQKIGGRV